MFLKQTNWLFLSKIDCYRLKSINFSALSRAQGLKLSSKSTVTWKIKYTVDWILGWYSSGWYYEASGWYSWRFRGAVGRTPPFRDSTPCRPFALFSDIHFWLTDLKIFLMAPIYTNFEGGARAEKTRFFGQHFPKMPKNAFFRLFSKNSPENWSK